MAQDSVASLLISKIPEGPSPRVAYLFAARPGRFTQALTAAMAEQEGILEQFAPRGAGEISPLSQLAHKGGRSYELLIIEGDLAPDATVLQNCWLQLENSAHLIVTGASQMWVDPLNRAGFSHPALIDLEDERVLIAHKTFAWGSQ